MKQFTLHKKERLKKRKSIEQVFEEGVSFSFYPLRVYYLYKSNRDGMAKVTDEAACAEPILQFGCGVSKKHFKKATDRNRIKRLVREGYRLQKLPLQQAIAVQKNSSLKLFIIFTGKELPKFYFIKEKVQAILQRLEAETLKRS